MEMEIPFPFCVPVAAGIVSVFMGNPLKKDGITLHTSEKKKQRT